MVLLAVAAAGVEQHVGRLDVTVHQAVQVGRVERGRHLGDDAGGPVAGQRAELVDQLAHVAALDEAHGDVQHAVALPGGEDRDDVRMVHRGRGPRLTDEPLTERLVRAQRRGQQLQRHVPAQLDVAGTVNEGHAALADLLLEPVAGHLRTDRVPPRTWVVAPAHSSSPTRLEPWACPRRAPLREHQEKREVSPQCRQMFTRIIVAGPLGGQAAGPDRDLSAAVGLPNYTAVIYPQAHPQAVDNSPIRRVDRDSMSTSPVGKPGSMAYREIRRLPLWITRCTGLRTRHSRRRH